MSSEIILKSLNEKQICKLPRIILAPLAGITCLPFRILNREAGAKFAFTEMISARALCYAGKRTMEMILTSRKDQPLGVQLLAKECPQPSMWRSG